jgi:hypothetical protein
MKLLTPFFAALLLAAPLATMSAPRDADACGNALVEVRDEMNGNINYATAVKRAERYLARGKNAEALSTIAQTYYELTQLDERYKTPEKIKRNGSRTHKHELVPRAARIAALALVRTNGRMTFDEYPGRVKSGSAKRLAWAVGVLSYLHERDPNDASLRNYHAEALAAQPDKKAEALAAFGALEKEGLLLSSSKAPLERLRADKPAVADDGKDDPRPRGLKGAKGAKSAKSAKSIDSSEGALGDGGSQGGALSGGSAQVKAVTLD